MIQLYLFWGKADEAARWRARLAPGSPAERVGFAEMSYDRKRYATAARLWSEALEADPNLGEDRRAGHRYNAACRAALAAAGKGVDEPADPDEAVKARLRGGVLGWLQAELAAWSRELETDPAQGGPAIAKALDHWQYDPDLEGIRDAPGAGQFPGGRAERTAIAVGDLRIPAGAGPRQDPLNGLAAMPSDPDGRGHWRKVRTGL